MTSSSVARPLESAAASDPESLPLPGSGVDFGRIVNAASGAELVALLRDRDLGAITAGLSPEQIQQVVQKFGADNDFNAWLTTVAPPPPPGVINPPGPGGPGAFVPPPLPTGAELDRLIANAQNSGQGPLIKDATGQIINQYGEIMVLDSGGNLAPAPRDVPVGMRPDGNGSFMPDPNWAPPNLPPEYVQPVYVPPEGYTPPPPPPKVDFRQTSDETNVGIVGQHDQPPTVPV